MADNEEKSRVDEAREANMKSDYYDKVDEKELERSAQNVSVPDPRSRDLWQSTTVSTDGNGPRVEDVTPAFAQARADALGNPASVDGDTDEDAQAEGAEAAAAAQAEADRIRAQAGYVAPTGADAGVYDDAKLEGAVPKENYSPEPELGEDERDSREAAAEEKSRTAGAQNVDTTETAQKAPAKSEENDDASKTKRSSSRRSSTGSSDKKE